MHSYTTPYRTIPVGHGRVAIVDADDYEWLASFRWHASPPDYYARRHRIPDTGTVVMHREIMAAPVGVEVDHINGDRLDNRRANLRYATDHDQQGNLGVRRQRKTSRFKGVSWHRQRQKWNAQIRRFGKTISLGLHRTEVDAARAYDAAAVQQFGQFARINFPADGQHGCDDWKASQ